VIPSERTRATVKIVDGSIRGFAPTHPGAVILFIGEVDFTTDIVGDSPDFSFDLSVPSLSVLFADSFSGPYDRAGAEPVQVPSTPGGTPHWKVCPTVLFMSSKLMGFYRV